jgi:hypothetical protein
MRRKLTLRHPLILQLISQTLPRLRRRGQRVGCLEWAGYCKPGGYPIVQFALKRYRLPDLVWILRHSDPMPFNHVVSHTCGNRKCIERTHLVLRPAWEVARERMRRRPVGQKGFVGLRGEANRRAVLTNEQVLYMRRRCEEGTSIRQMAKELGIAYSHAWYIVKRQHWTCI